MANFPTDDFSLSDPSDSSKILNFSVSNFTTGTGFQRTISAPDYPGLAVLADAENSGGTLKLLFHYGSSTVAPTWSAPELPDDLFRIVDNGDSAKKIAFQASGITSGNTRTITAQDADGTVAYKITGASVLQSPVVTAVSNLTAQSAAITATTIYAVPAAGAGLYQVSWVATVTTAATTSSVLGGTNGFQVIFTDVNDSVVKTSNPTAVSNFTTAGNTTASSVSGTFNAYCKASTNLQYAFDYTSVGATPMQYDLSIRVLYLG